MRPRPGDRTQLAPLLKLLSRGIVTGGDAGEFAERYVKLLGTEGIVFGQQHAFFAAQQFCEGIDPGWMRTYSTLQHLDPAESWLARHPGEPYFAAAQCNGPEWPGGAHDELREALFAAGYSDAFTTRTTLPFGPPMFLGTYRARGAPPLGEAERALIVLLHPHIRLAFAARSALGAIHAGLGEGLAAALLRVSGHAFITLPQARFDWPRRGRAVWQRRLPALGERGWPRIERMIVRAMSEARSRAVRSMRILGVRVEFALVPPLRGEEARALVLFFEEDSAPRLSPVAELLSPRQLAVARLLVVGASLAAIGTQLGIGRETARTLLSQIYKRLGVHSRAQLASVLLETS